MANATHLTTILAAISTVLTIYITYASHQIDGRIKEGDAALRRLQTHLDEKFRTADLELRRAVEDRAMRQGEENFNLQVYEKVWTALQTSERRKHDVAYALVQSLDEERTLKKYLLGLFQTPGVAPETRAAASVSIFRIEQQVVARDAAQRTTASPSAAKSLVSYDVFWCEGRPEGEQRASAVADRIRAQSGVGRVRVRFLPDAVNRKESRFGVTGLVIRKDPDEGALADQLKKWIDPVIAPEVFTIHTNAQGTPGYLSAFICGAS